jgi:hypothetical protein
MRLEHAVWALLAGLLLSTPASAQQLFVLDFDTFTDTVSDEAKDHLYSPVQRGAIVDMLNDKFASYPVSFSATAPAMGDYSTIFFNVGLSEADNIDFRNLDRSDDARIHIPKLLEVSGLTPPFTPADLEIASINIAAHEALHLLGTRHHDSYLPIGGGPPTAAIGLDYTPAYIGPAMATLTAKEFNSLTTSIGFSAEKLLDRDLFIGPRSAIKLLLDEFIDLEFDSADANIGTAPQPLELKTIPIPNPFTDPVVSGLRLFADVAVVKEGSIDVKPFSDPPVPESDYYEISAEKDDFIHIEVWSDQLDFRLSSFDATVVLRDSVTFTPVPWPTAFFATSFDERESSDAFLWDVRIPVTGTYVIEVTHDYGPGTSEPGRMFGEYEMLVYRLRAVPEPSALLLALLAGWALLVLPQPR